MRAGQAGNAEHAMSRATVPRCVRVPEEYGASDNPASRAARPALISEAEHIAGQLVTFRK